MATTHYENRFSRWGKDWSTRQKSKDIYAIGTQLYERCSMLCEALDKFITIHPVARTVDSDEDPEEVFAQMPGGLCEEYPNIPAIRQEYFNVIDKLANTTINYDKAKSVVAAQKDRMYDDDDDNDDDQDDHNDEVPRNHTPILSQNDIDPSLQDTEPTFVQCLLNQNTLYYEQELHDLSDSTCDSVNASMDMDKQDTHNEHFGEAREKVKRYETLSAPQNTNQHLHQIKSRQAYESLNPNAGTNRMEFWDSSSSNNEKHRKNYDTDDGESRNENNETEIFNPWTNPAGEARKRALRHKSKGKKQILIKKPKMGIAFLDEDEEKHLMVSQTKRPKEWDRATNAAALFSSGSHSNVHGITKPISHNSPVNTSSKKRYGTEPVLCSQNRKMKASCTITHSSLYGLDKDDTQDYRSQWIPTAGAELPENQSENPTIKTASEFLIPTDEDTQEYVMPTETTLSPSVIDNKSEIQIVHNNDFNEETQNGTNPTKNTFNPVFSTGQGGDSPNSVSPPLIRASELMRTVRLQNQKKHNSIGNRHVTINIDSDRKCPVCLSASGVDFAKITSCGHIYCSDCLTRIINLHNASNKSTNPKCALCQKTFHSKFDVCYGFRRAALSLPYKSPSSKEISSNRLKNYIYQLSVHRGDLPSLVDIYKDLSRKNNYSLKIDKEVTGGNSRERRARDLFLLMVMIEDNHKWARILKKLMKHRTDAMIGSMIKRCVVCFGKENNDTLLLVQPCCDCLICQDCIYSASVLSRCVQFAKHAQIEYYMVCPVCRYHDISKQTFKKIDSLPPSKALQAGQINIFGHGLFTQEHIATIRTCLKYLFRQCFTLRIKYRNIKKWLAIDNLHIDIIEDMPALIRVLVDNH